MRDCCGRGIPGIAVFRSRLNELQACDRRPDDGRLLTSARREVANVWNIVAVSSLVAAAAMADDYPNHRDYCQHGFNVDIVVISS